MHLQTSTPAVHAGAALHLPLPREIAIGDVVMQHLRTPDEISSVLHLRDEIDLSVHAAAGPRQFKALEKKETSAATSSDLHWMASGSARYASCRWATASH